MLTKPFFTSLCLISTFLFVETAAFSADYISPKANANRLYLSGANKNKVYKTVDHTDDDPSYSSNDYFRGQPGIYRNEVSAGLGLNYFKSFGLQLRYAARILDEGFIPDVNDSFFIEGSVGPTFYGTVNGTASVTGFHFLVTGRWDFRVNQQWTLFGDLGFGYNFVSSDAKSSLSSSGVFPAIGVGALYNFTEELAARFDFSYQNFGIGALFRF